VEDHHLLDRERNGSKTSDGTARQSVRKWPRIVPSNAPNINQVEAAVPTTRELIAIQVFDQISYFFNQLCS
jgi:hypothetical protein